VRVYVTDCAHSPLCTHGRHVHNASFCCLFARRLIASCHCCLFAHLSLRHALGYASALRQHIMAVAVCRPGVHHCVNTSWLWQIAGQVCRTVSTHSGCARLQKNRCVGHSGNVEHIDWSYPISQPGSRLHGQMIIQAADSSGNLLYWDVKTGVCVRVHVCVGGKFISDICSRSLRTHSLTKVLLYKSYMWHTSCVCWCITVTHTHTHAR